MGTPGFIVHPIGTPDLHPRIARFHCPPLACFIPRMRMQSHMYVYTSGCCCAPLISTPARGPPAAMGRHPKLDEKTQVARYDLNESGTIIDLGTAICSAIFSFPPSRWSTPGYGVKMTNTMRYCRSITKTR